MPAIRSNVNRGSWSINIQRNRNDREKLSLEYYNITPALKHNFYYISNVNKKLFSFWMFCWRERRQNIFNFLLK